MNGQHVHLASSTLLYYGPGASGSLLLQSNADEQYWRLSASGIYGVRFPALFYEPVREDTDTGDTAYTMSYTITGAASTSGQFQIAALDRVGNPNPQEIYVLKDTVAPTLSNQTLSVANGLHVYLASSTLLYYGPDASGSLTVSVDSGDPDVQGYN